MAIIQIPARSIVGKPKLNISNDNNYESVGYTKQSTAFNYKELGTYKLDIINVTTNELLDYEITEMQTVLWTKFFSMTNRYGLKENNIDKNIKVYEFQNGTVATKIIPISGGGWYNFVLKITISKPDINFDYLKTDFGYWADFRMLYPIYDADKNVKFTHYVYSEHEGISEIPIQQLPISFVYDKSVTDTQMLTNIKVGTNLDVINTAGGIVPIVAVRINDDSFDFFVNNGVVKGNISLDELTTIYSPQTFKFYYKDIERTSLGNVNENAKYSLPDNELLAEQTTYNGESIYNQISNSIVSEYEKGKFSVDLSCLYMQYKDSNGNVVYSGTDGKMISIGDIIQPYYYKIENGDLPVATYEDGSAMCFKVYKSEIETQDSKYITNSISAIEIQQPVPYTINVTANRDDISKLVQLNGVAIEGSAVAYTGDTIFIPASNIGNWTNVSVNGVSYTLETHKVGIGFSGYSFNVTSDMEIYFYYKSSGSIN